MSCRSRNAACRGYTLLEVLLALGLTAIVLLIVTSGITVQLRAFSAGRARVERAQLARVLLHRMADDLRGALPPTKTDASTSTSLGSGSGATSSGTGTEGGSTSGTEGQSSGLQNAAEGDSQTDLAETTTSTTSADATAVGVYGELDWLRVDVVRVPRSENGSSDAAGSSSSTSGEAKRQVKTVVYYVISADEATAAAGAAESDGQPAGGLVRRELTRPSAVWAAEQASMQYRDPSVSPLASEVRAVEFRYHDGSDWVESWDTATSGSLPKAIEIRLYLAPLPTTTLGGALQPAGDATTGADEETYMQYRLVVPMTLEAAGGSTGGATSSGTTDETGNQTGTETGGQTSSGSSSGSSSSGSTTTGSSTTTGGTSQRQEGTP